MNPNELNNILNNKMYVSIQIGQKKNTLSHHIYFIKKSFIIIHNAKTNQDITADELLIVHGMNISFYIKAKTETLIG